jgi:hypothetical protein
MHSNFCRITLLWYRRLEPMCEAYKPACEYSGQVLIQWPKWQSKEQGSLSSTAAPQLFFSIDFHPQTNTCSLYQGYCESRIRGGSAEVKTVKIMRIFNAFVNTLGHTITLCFEVFGFVRLAMYKVYVQQIMNGTWKYNILHTKSFRLQQNCITPCS